MHKYRDIIHHASMNNEMATASTFANEYWICSGTSI